MRLDHLLSKEHLANLLVSRLWVLGFVHWPAFPVVGGGFPAVGVGSAFRIVLCDWFTAPCWVLREHALCVFFDWAGLAAIPDSTRVCGVVWWWCVAGVVCCLRCA